ncbi:MAG: hypothetical protein ACE5GJ_13355 [Gemmatimonadota bacterium]
MRLRVSAAAAMLLSVAAHLSLRGDAREGLPSPGAQEGPIVIEIVIDGDSVRAVPDVVEVVRGQRIEWVSDLGEWRVIFTSPAPFGPEASGNGIGAGRSERAGRNVRAAAPEGRYKYMIQVRDGNRMRIADPEIVIGPGE